MLWISQKCMKLVEEMSCTSREEGWGKEKNTFPFAFEKDVLIKYQVISYFD